MQHEGKLKNASENVKDGSVKKGNERNVNVKRKSSVSVKNVNSVKEKGRESVNGNEKEKERKGKGGRWRDEKWNENDCCNSKDLTTTRRQFGTDHRFEMARMTFE